MTRGLRRLFFVHRPWQPRADPSTDDIQRLLVLLLLPIGDTLFVTPTIRALRLRYPHARLDAIAYPSNSGILDGNPDIDHLYVYPTRATWTGVRAYLTLLSSMNARRYDLIVECAPYQWWLTTLLGVPRRLHMKMPIPLWFIPTKHRPWKDRHAVDSYATLLRDVAIPVDTRQVVVVPSAQHVQGATLFLQEEEIEAHMPVLGIHPGGEGFHGLKRWEAEKFAAVASVLARDYGARVLVFGGPDEFDLAAQVAASIGPLALSLAGKTSLGVATALLKKCFLFIGNDSAPMHMAAAVGTPTLGIFGPSNAWNYHPVGRHVAVVRHGIACSPCFHFVGTTTVWGGSRCRDNQCLQELTPDRVLAVARSLMQRVAIDGRSRHEAPHL